MQYILLIILILGTLAFRKARFYRAYMIIFMLIVFGLNTHHLGHSHFYNMDFGNYYSLYLSNSQRISTRDIEVGFQTIMLFANKLGLSFNAFRMLLGIVGYALIISTIKVLTKNTNQVLALYLIFPFFNDVIQIRNFLSMSIVIYASRYLVRSRKSDALKYVLLVLLASRIHTASLFYLVFLLAKKLKVKTLMKLVPFVSIIMTILAYTNLYPVLANLFTDNARLLSYFTRRTTWGLPVVLSVMLMYFFTYFIMYDKSSNLDGSASAVGLPDMLLKMNILLLTIAPLLVYNFNFIRLYRNILPLNYIVFINAIHCNGNKPNIALGKSFIMLAFIGFLFIFFYGMNAQTQILPVFEDNYIFNMMKW